MSRFVNLEFDGGLENQFDQREGTRDEAYYLQSAEESFQKGQFELALRLFARVLEFNPKNVAAWSGQVRMLIELGEFREAKLWADKALERFPTAAELLAGKAVALARLGDVQAAMAFSDASMEERGDTPYIWLARGDVLLAREEKRADYCFDKAMALAPSDWVVPWLASRILFFYQKLAVALKFAQEALARQAGQAVIWFQLGRSQQAVGLSAYAAHSFARALELDASIPDLAAALLEVQHVGLWGKLRNAWRQLFYPA